MRLPNLLIAGMPRCGTTIARRVLRNHPEVYMPDGKALKRLTGKHAEIHFFNRDENYEKGLDWYLECFKGENGEKYVGEKTPWYSRLPAPERIRNDLGPDVKLLMFFRDPAARAYSHWVRSLDHPHGEKYEGKSFGECIREEKKHARVKHFKEVATEIVNAAEADAAAPVQAGIQAQQKTESSPDKGEREYSLTLMQGSRYAFHLKNLLEFHKRDNIYIMINEEVKANPREEYSKMFDWLGLRTLTSEEWASPRLQKRVNLADYDKYGNLSEEDEYFLKECLEYDTEEFYNLIGREIEAWKWKK